MAQFKFVGSARSSKISWPLRAQAAVIKAHRVQGLPGAKAFEAGVAAFNATAASTEQIVELPKSYTNKNAGSVLYGMEKRFLARCDSADANTLAIAREFGIVEPLA